MNNPYGQLYRLSYQRNGRVLGLTFFAADLADALAFEKIWERMTKCPVLALKAVGQSRFVDRKGRTVLRDDAKSSGTSC